jgi:hypothetical protein
MLAEKQDNGPTMVVGFGVGFTGSAGIMSYNEAAIYVATQAVRPPAAR